MAYVKLDCGMLDSTLWFDRQAREVFITALLMAVPLELKEPARQYEVESITPTGFVVPPNWYGFVAAAGPAIIERAKVDQAEGIAALKRLGDSDPTSRTPDFEGKRMVRIDGGYLILNYDRYRNKDHTAAERARRYRDKKAKDKETSRVTGRSSHVTSRSVTEAEAEAEVEVPHTPLTPTPQNSNGRVSDLRTQLCRAFNRKDETPWGNDEEHMLVDTARRPYCLIELTEMLATRPKRGRYFPQSLSGLLQNWTKTLDIARNPAAQEKPLSVLDLKTIRDAKEAEAQDIAHKHSFEDAMSRKWQSTEAHAQYRNLKQEIKQLTHQIATTQPAR